jgi:hypothetical protein
MRRGWAHALGRAAWLGAPVCGLAVCGLLPAGLRAQQPDADVVVLSDTSLSMMQNDPKNAVVLVTRLLADLVRGNLSAVRLLDVAKDSAKIAHEDTKQKQPCPDRPSEMCAVVKLGPEALQQTVDQHLLVKKRDGRGDSSFKTSLAGLLGPTAAQTAYTMSWASIQRIFQDNASSEDTPRVVVWLSDGDADDWGQARPRVQELLDRGVAIRALVFKSGKTDQVKQVGIDPYPVDGSPRDLMRAFADAFRYIVQAPFRADGQVSKEPSFTVKPHMEEVWVVVYGDDSLSAAAVSHGGKTVQAEYAADRHNGSAYRVAHLENPADGSWEVSAAGGGAETSYAVIQRSTITPVVDAPKEAITGTPFPLTAVLRVANGGQDLLPADLPEPVKIEAQFEGQTFPLNDNGSDGDAKAGDGKFTAMLTAHKAGPVVIRVRAHNSFLDRVVKVTVRATGFFRYNGGPVDINFGTLKAGSGACRVLNFAAEQQGSVPFELRERERLPDNLRIELRAGGKRHSPGGDPIDLMPDSEKKVCLVTGRDARDSRSEARIWVSLAVKGMDTSQVPLRMTWSVWPLSFWERWGTLILLILAFLVVFFIIYGYIKPYRFPPGLAISYGPGMDDLDDQTPQPVRMWRGVGIGFYRDARACLQENFRVNGQVKGAVSILQAGPRKSVFVKPASRPVYREVGFREWDQVPANGRRAGQGEIYRVGESGPYFRLSMRAPV